MDTTNNRGTLIAYVCSLLFLFVLSLVHYTSPQFHPHDVVIIKVVGQAVQSVAKEKQTERKQENRLPNS